ncbi:MAG: hypothetical protein RIE86_18555 [Imperialibacter sp.]|uniref:hypothetical protein n=1 Tax=Imperialibacter sp. TaxID=2038411 RepID=UPI0032EB15F6
MGYIKEPEGVDFVINSEPLTAEDRKRISEFIADYKATHKQKKSKTTLRKRKKDGRKHHA